MRRLMLTAIVCLPLALRAQANVETVDSIAADSSAQKPLPAAEFRFRPVQLAAPAALVVLGTLGLVDGSPIDKLESHACYDMNPSGRKTKADEYVQYVPTAAHLLMGFIPGTRPRHNFRDRVLASATANLLMAAATNTVKYTVKEKRPDSNSRNSFFSGHTATAFTGAELVRIEYGPVYGSVAYAAATSVAFMRVWNKRHWVGDVLAGAGVGILCADAGYWLLPVWKRLFRINDREARRAEKGISAVVAVPFYQPEDRGAGLSCSITL